jgi:bacterioferritin-associated ferredoxin
VIVCHCEVVRAEEIRTAVRLGAACAEDVTEACGAGGRCGGCLPAICEVIQQERHGLALASSPAA